MDVSAGMTHPISVLCCYSCRRTDTNGYPAAEEEGHRTCKLQVVLNNGYLMQMPNLYVDF